MSNNQVEACLLMNRRIEQRQEHSITHTEITERRVIQEEPSEMQHYKSGIGSDLGSGGGAYHPHSNGHQPGVDHSPHSSHLSLHSDGKVSSSKVMHEVTHQHVGSDAQSLDYVAMPLSMYPATMHQCGQYVDYDHMEPQYHLHFRDYEQYPGGYATGGVPAGSYGTYGERAPGSPPSPSERSGGPSPQHDAPEYLPTCYDELADRFGATPSPGLATADPRYAEDARAVAYGYAPPAAYGVRAFDGLPPLDGAVRAPISASRAGTLGRGRPTPDDEPHGMRWRDPNLTEVIGFLDNPNNVIKANAAAYLQHLCYMDDPNKQKTRALGGIPPLVRLLSNDSSDVYRNACGALRNLSYGRQNDENKRAIKNAGGIPALIDLLRRTTEGDVKELVTGVVWNMSSCEDLKRAIIDDGVAVIVTHVVAPHSGWDPVRPGETHWSNVFRNASGVLRNVSSAGEYARKKLRECDGLVDALLYVVRSAIDKANIGNKIVENCVCVLRNLSYRCQEVEDPNYDRNPPPTQSRATENPSKGENLGCFGASKKKRDAHSVTDQKSASGSAGSGPGRNPGERRDTPRGAESLWQPDVVQSYLALLQSCSNPETLEAAAGALQNLSACYWQPSIEIRAAVRKEKGLPILVELLRMEVDRVVCAVATALRNLAIDQRNKELIGKYAMRDLVQKLPSGNTQHDQGTSDDTIAAVLATLNEVVKKNAEFSRSLLESGGVDRLMNVTRQRQKYTPRVLKFASQVLVTMWQHPELRDAYKKHGWKEPDFVAKTTASRDATGGPNSPNNANSTLNRPMASQGGTRYEDRTMKRANSAAASADGPGIPPPDGTALYHRRTADDIVAVDASAVAYADGGAARGAPVVGGVRIYPPGVIAQPPANDAEPLYARVDLEKKRNRHSNVEAAADRREAGGGEAERPLEARDDSWV